MIELACTAFVLGLTGDQLTGLKSELLNNGYQEADAQILLFKNGRIPLKPGCDAIQVRHRSFLNVYMYMSIYLYVYKCIYAYMYICIYVYMCMNDE